MGTAKGTTWGTVCEQQSAAIRTFAKSGHTEGTNTKKEEEREYIDISSQQKKENTPDGVSKKDKLSSPSLSEKIDYSGLMEYYNSTFKDRLQQIKSMTDVRKRL